MGAGVVAAVVGWGAWRVEHLPKPERSIRVALVHDEQTTREGLQRLAAVL